MTEHHQPDWDPRSDEALQNQLTTCDHMRRTCPVAFSDYLQWSVFEHADVERVLLDHSRFSNVVSTHLSVPNGMDPPQHTPYRRLIEPFFAPAPMAAFEPVCREIARTLVDELVAAQECDLVASFAQLFALRVQCAFLGWPEAAQAALREWLRENQLATLQQNRPLLAELAQRFEQLVATLLEHRRQLGTHASADVTTQLLHARVEGRALTQAEIVSVLRNWTAGEIGTIAASVGILLHFLAEHHDLHRELRARPENLPEAIDEILRIHGPLATNRRSTTCPVKLGNREIAPAERLTLHWIAANRDEAVFPDAGQFRWGRDQSRNLLYGAGVHVCPGAPLARLELRVIMEEFLRVVTAVDLIAERPPTPAQYPGSGYVVLPAVLVI